jgi:hypothetical protein
MFPLTDQQQHWKERIFLERLSKLLRLDTHSSPMHDYGPQGDRCETELCP